MIRTAWQAKLGRLLRQVANRIDPPAPAAVNWNWLTTNVTTTSWPSNVNITYSSGDHP